MNQGPSYHVSGCRLTHICVISVRHSNLLAPRRNLKGCSQRAKERCRLMFEPRSPTCAMASCPGAACGWRPFLVRDSGSAGDARERHSKHRRSHRRRLRETLPLLPRAFTTDPEAYSPGQVFYNIYSLALVSPSTSSSVIMHACNVELGKGLQHGQLRITLSLRAGQWEELHLCTARVCRQHRVHR